MEVSKFLNIEVGFSENNNITRSVSVVYNITKNGEFEADEVLPSFTAPLWLSEGGALDIANEFLAKRKKKIISLCDAIAYDSENPNKETYVLKTKSCGYGFRVSVFFDLVSND